MLTSDGLHLGREWVGTWKARRPSWMKFMVSGAVELGTDRAVCRVLGVERREVVGMGMDRDGAEDEEGASKII